MLHRLATVISTRLQPSFFPPSDGDDAYATDLGGIPRIPLEIPLLPRSFSPIGVLTLWRR